VLVAELAERGVLVGQTGATEQVEIFVVGMHQREVDGFCVRVLVEVRELGLISSITHSDHLLR
jgi:hypothetical protein